jgi:GntR family transcriptional regulator
MNSGDNAMLLTLSDLSQEPLHAQISRQIRSRILAQDLTDDELLPSIRTLAREQRVSVITVQRAYEDLEHEGLIRSRPGKGFFVMAIPEGRKHAVAEQRFAAALAPIIEESRKAGLDDRQLRTVIKRVLVNSDRGGNQ